MEKKFYIALLYYNIILITNTIFLTFRGVMLVYSTLDYG